MLGLGAAKVMAMALAIATGWLATRVAADKGDQGPFSEYILTPRSRTLTPASVYNVNGTVDEAEGLTCGGSTTFRGASAVTYDFGKNVAGIVSFGADAVDGANELVGISFSESSLWIHEAACDATADAGIDEPLWFPVASGTWYSADKDHQRGGFRYLNVYHNTSGTVVVSNLTVHFTAVPHVADDRLGAYSGYFNSDDELLNRIWYAGAYTNELCTIDPTTGHALIHINDPAIQPNKTVEEPLTWYNNYTISNGTSVLVDGAKRDRLVWPGDMAIAIPSIAVATYDLDSIRTSLDSLLALQRADGQLPYTGEPFNSLLGQSFSFNYHLFTLIGIDDYYRWSGDVAYVQRQWDGFVRALDYSVATVDSSGLANVTSELDWLRYGMGGHNIAANAILHHTLTLGIRLAGLVNDTSAVVDRWAATAATIKHAAKARLWDEGASLYRDNDSLPLTTLHPQDGNVWAIVANLTDSPSQARAISAALATRWTRYGAPAPEAGATVSPFVSGFELQAHYVAGEPERAVQLMRRMWGFMLDDARMTRSTFIEGYSSDGSLHYAPYANDARVSHAHGWATGPTSALTLWAAGLRVAAAGREWVVAPSLGGLARADAGYHTRLGHFTARAERTPDGIDMRFRTPQRTSGLVSVEPPAEGGTLTLRRDGKHMASLDIPRRLEGRFDVPGLPGGSYEVSVRRH